MKSEYNSDKLQPEYTHQNWKVNDGTSFHGRRLTTNQIPGVSLQSRTKLRVF
jgi:hypothetical protein